MSTWTYVWARFFVRTGTPDDIVEKLAASFRGAMTSEEGWAFQAKNPGRPLMLGPREMGEFHLRGYQRFKRVAEAAGIQPQ